MMRVITIFIGCGVVLAVTLLVQSCSKKVEDVSTPKSSSTPQANTPKEITFRNTAIFDGRKQTGERFVSLAYKSSDCVVLSNRTTFFKTAARAQKALKEEIKEVSRVIERAPLVNDAGKQIGERLLVQLKTDQQDKPATQVIWNENSELHAIASKSAEHVLEFEKALKSGTGRISNGIEGVRQATFDEIESHDGKSEEGIAYTEKKFRSSDCEVIKLRVEQFPSPERAQQQLETMLAQSTSVMERAPKLDAQGQRIGERVMAMFKASPPSEYIEDTTIVWTNKSELYSLTGAYAYVIVFEQRNYH